MKLIKETNGAWETHLVEGYPFGIERVTYKSWTAFRLWGSRRVYIREADFISKEQAIAYLEPMVAKYQASIIEAVIA